MPRLPKRDDDPDPWAPAPALPPAVELGGGGVLPPPASQASTGAPFPTPAVDLDAVPPLPATDLRAMPPRSDADPLPGAAHPHRAIRSYVLRAGRIGSGQRRALDALAPRFVLPNEDRRFDAEAIFGRRAPLVVEIGFGMGDATATIAAANPGTDFIGIEVHGPGVGALLQRIEAGGLANLRIVRDDAVRVFEQRVAPASLAGVHVFFPDPWHKKKHHKRRLIQPGFVALLADRLAPGGRVHCATDWQPYAEQMLDVLDAEARLVNTTDGYAPRPAHRPLTKFEQRGQRLGHGVWDLVFERRG